MSKKVTKRIVSFLVALVMMIGASTSVFAAESAVSTSDGATSEVVAIQTSAYSATATSTEYADFYLEPWETKTYTVPLNTWAAWKKFHIYVDSTGIGEPTQGAVYFTLRNPSGKIISNDWILGLKDIGEWTLTFVGYGNYTLTINNYSNAIITGTAWWY